MNSHYSPTPADADTERARAVRRVHQKLGVQIHALSYVIGNAAQIVVWWLATPELFFWPLWSIGSWGIGLLFHVLAVYVWSGGVSERRIQKEMGRN
ncbi:2TM domain-containing protein [Actinoplanes solisilvae]|uniref:2TM domain-containing protein n=1 Tax=Actinoplanes solisilvae TaxID=2486853 RepID=UPI000FDC5920|nr:2TM domain-containing protein [Actinoplanes solisilvae]